MTAPIVCITGATAGIGLACAHAFHRAGYRVIAIGRRAERLRALRDALGEGCHPLALDVSDAEGVRRAFEALPEPFHAVTTLVNNAGFAAGGLEPAHRAKLEDWENMVSTNILGVLRVTHALLPGMVARGEGHILNLGSIAGTYPYPGSNVYGATKAFLEQFTLNLRADLLGTGLRCTNIEPGMVETEFSLVRFGDEAQAGAVYAGAEPLTAQDIAEIVLWCAQRPRHVNINRLEVMPTCQAFGALPVDRKPA